MFYLRDESSECLVKRRGEERVKGEEIEERREERRGEERKEGKGEGRREDRVKGEDGEETERIE